MPPKRKAAVTKSETKPVELETNEEEPVITKPSKSKRAKKEVKEKAVKEKAAPAVEEVNEEDDDVQEAVEPAETKKKTKATAKGKKAAAKQNVEEETENGEEVNGGAAGDLEGDVEENGKESPVNGKEDEEEVQIKGKKGKGRTAKKAKEVKEVEAEQDVENGNPSGSRRQRGGKKPKYVDEDSDEDVKVSKKKAKRGKAAGKESSDEEEEIEPKKKGRAAKAAPAKKKEAPAAPLNQTDTNWEKVEFDCKKTNPKGDEYNLKIVSWNVDGLRACLKKDGAKIFEHAKPDIICLQEVKCDKDDVSEEMSAAVEGYEQYWVGSEKGGYAGVAIFSKVKPLNITYGIGDDSFNDEGRCITAEYENFYLVGVYVPNAGRKLVTLPKRLEWNDAFKKFVKDLDEKKPVIICGDLNVAHNEIDLANPKTNTKNAGFTQEERDGLTDFLDSGFVDTFRKLYPEDEKVYTFWTYMSKARAKNVGWRLDYFLVSDRIMENVCDNVVNKEVFGSDHCPITLFINI